jgi:hypothetical protein
MMAEMRTVIIRIGPLACTTSVEIARKLVCDPALLLRCYDMMREAARSLDTLQDLDPPLVNRLRHRLD